MLSSDAAHEMKPGMHSLLESVKALEENGTLDSLPDEAVQRLFGAVLKEYVNRLNENPGMQPFADHAAVTATEAVIGVTRILNQINVEVFELAMWQTMGSIR
jgi:hypothetical protein